MTLHLLLVLFLIFPSLVRPSALTTTVAPNERLCFYADVDKAGEKIAVSWRVQAGGTFDIDWEIIDPNGWSLLSGEREHQGDFILTANHVGEYTFCFENDMSTITHKLVDFDIMVESEPRRESPARPGQISEKTSALDESIWRLRGSLTSIERQQRYFHTRETRGFSVVKSTQNRIFWYAVLDCCAIITMAVIQIYVLQTFFTTTGKKYKV
ncbi:emp24/gp25L/p24 family/GOLD-domain-containing protein [Cantharellus anzutake]|uniref:emp24/gp25L/p24 family/GOLD-domain-containing protein n=1 Tax=Cantharellus anzutake TaxID=1750568 RepID=UPI00190793EC|nr:emp24/gp25L/p24 family/GOLD-domain-containing protein [Cantharellus anzutake]KAF8337338.1 emp24/gp25L/p24 family/GOLD-domain-containing protein [Cantharellus anzutake]